MRLADDLALYGRTTSAPAGCFADRISDGVELPRRGRRTALLRDIEIRPRTVGQRFRPTLTRWILGPRLVDCGPTEIREAGVHERDESVKTSLPPEPRLDDNLGPALGARPSVATGLKRFQLDGVGSHH